MTPPLVTIGMPTFNNAGTLRRAVNSVLEQNSQSWLLRISDDGSSDDTWAICRELADADPRIKITQQSKRRAFMNFGDLLSAADTPYFAWLAADDYWAPGFLTRCQSALESCPEAVSALPRCSFIGDRPPPSTESLTGSEVDRVRRYLANPGGTRMYGLGRTPVFKDAFPPRNMNAYDWYFMLGILCQGWQIEVPEVLLFREYTDWMHYAEIVDDLYDHPLYRRFPVFEMSLAAWRAGIVPRENLRDLVSLNLRKHEEYLAIMRPRSYSRRAWLFRRMGLPLSSHPTRVAEIAEEIIRRDPKRGLEAIAMLKSASKRNRPNNDRSLFSGLTGKHRLAAASIPRNSLTKFPPDITAVLACRNAASTLPRLLSHLENAGAQVVLINHSSTDETRRIAETRYGRSVVEIVDEGFDGIFDLTRQLDLKRQVISTIKTGWILCLDADEFVDPPSGRTLKEAAAEASSQGHITMPCREYMFLPSVEAEQHSPDSFDRTLCTYVPISDRDPKQRLFHHDSSLDIWMATGGHTITRDPAEITPWELTLRHYPGLSLDEIRARYFSRVFAQRDLAKLWHGARTAALHYDILAPPKGVLKDSEAIGLDPGEPLRTPPVFFPLTTPRFVQVRENAPTDLILLCAPGAAADEFASSVCDAVPGLRLLQTTDLSEVPTHPLPVLHLIEHPAVLVASSDLEPRALATHWVRRVARARQLALRPGPGYLEVRVEDRLRADALISAVSSLILGKGPRGRSGFLTSGLPHVAKTWSGPISVIAAPLARDLGYI